MGGKQRRQLVGKVLHLGAGYCPEQRIKNIGYVAQKLARRVQGHDGVFECRRLGIVDNGIDLSLMALDPPVPPAGTAIWMRSKAGVRNGVLGVTKNGSSAAATLPRIDGARDRHRTAQQQGRHELEKTVFLFKANSSVSGSCHILLYV